jgi:hypothetical protein
MKKTVRTFTATERDLRMLETLAQYHGFSKSGTITNLIKKEFWRIFPAGTSEVAPEPGARITGAANGGENAR